MKPVLLDTDILSYYFKKHPNVVSNLENYVSEGQMLYISRITIIEILGGLRAKGATKQIQTFLEFVGSHTILDTTADSADASATAFAELWKKGKHSGNFDLLIAGIAIANNLQLATNNLSDYMHISNLDIINWAERV